MPRQGTYTQEAVNELLDEFISPQECLSTLMPTDLPPKRVAEYLNNRLAASVGPTGFGRAMVVARFYVMRECVDTLTGFVDDAPKDDAAFRMTCRAITAVSELGTQPQQQAAVNAFNALRDGKLVENAKLLEELVESYFDLPPGTNAKALTERVTTLRSACEKKDDTSALWRFREIERRLLNWVTHEKGRKDWNIKMPAGPERIRRWAESYLMFDMETPFKWDRSAGFGLLRAARAEGDEAAVEALRGAMSRIDPENDDPKEVKFRKTRGYHARAYFLEELDPALKRDRDKAAEPQEDLIV